MPSSPGRSGLSNRFHADMIGERKEQGEVPFVQPAVA
jgi:hypothetical protein